MPGHQIQNIPVNVTTGNNIPDDASPDDQQLPFYKRRSFVQLWARVGAFVRSNVKIIVPVLVVVLLLLSLAGYFVYTEFAGPSGSQYVPYGEQQLLPLPVVTHTATSVASGLVAVVSRNRLKTAGLVLGAIILVAVLSLALAWPKLMVSVRIELPGGQHLLLRDIDASYTVRDLRKAIQEELQEGLPLEDRDLATSWAFLQRSGDKVVELSDTAKLSDHIPSNTLTALFRPQDRLDFVAPTHYVKVNDFTTWTDGAPSLPHRVPALPSMTYRDVLSRFAAGTPGRLDHVTIEGVRSLDSTLLPQHLASYKDATRTDPSTVRLVHPDNSKVFVLQSPLDYRQTVEVYAQDVRKVTVGNLLKAAGQVPNGRGLDYSGVMVDAQGRELDAASPASAIASTGTGLVVVDFDAGAGKVKSMVMAYAPHTTYEQFVARVTKGLHQQGLQLPTNPSLSFKDADGGTLSAKDVTNIFDDSYSQKLVDFFSGKASRIKVQVK